MTPLLLKDFYVLLRQCKIFIAMILLLSIMQNPSVSMVAVLYGAILPLTAFAYDEQSDFGKLAKALPYSIWALTVSKYVMGYLALLVTTLLATVSKLLMGGAFSLSYFFLPLWVGALIIALTIPLIIIFGAEKGRMYLFFGGFGLSFLGTFIMKKFPMPSLLSQPQSLALPAFALLLVITALSLAISMNFNSRKLN